MVKKIKDPVSGSEMKIPEYIFESLVTIFGVTTDAGAGSRIFLILELYPGSELNIPDPLSKDFLLFNIVDKVFFTHFIG